ncbi:class F sortase [Nocardioides daeguensis]|uniref:class F sortase n=1 Tax=Nocardioides daeguensis TaxID=908359 RepID=UPI001C46C2CB|nr:class F sortase [Nocardioides daeguensis]MBV6726926.1 class F sortase [Nocardioides daeguensis]MCR1772925.1 class F sortase [Nocardioides daeguensis]
MAVEEERRRSELALVAGVVVLAVLCAGLLLRGGDEPERPAAVPTPAAPTPTPTPTPAPAPAPDPCARQASAGFVPTTISVPGVTRKARVLALPRDAAGVPGVPPVADKLAFAWDRGGIEPGSAAGHVLLNTHTWPDGTAMGNKLLAGLDVGGRLVLAAGKGETRRTACYTVTERTEVLASAGFPGWDAADGPPEVVIVVCSGKRLGPGNWTHRTLWFASPATAA